MRQTIMPTTLKTFVLVYVHAIMIIMEQQELIMKPILIKEPQEIKFLKAILNKLNEREHSEVVTNEWIFFLFSLNNIKLCG